MHERPMEVHVPVAEMAMSEMAVSEVPVSEVPVSEMAAAPETAPEPTAAKAAATMANFDGQVVGQIFGLRRRRRIDQRHSLRALDRNGEQHQPRHGEEAKQSFHQCNPSLDPEWIRARVMRTSRSAPACTLATMT
jgi:hypothetical protein